jgi:drug/metabolite transporter (DMT)-like permease
VLGVLLAGEGLSATSVLGGLITLAAVVIVVSQEGRRRVQRVPVDPAVPAGALEQSAR